MRRRKESKGNAESLRADPLSAVAELASFLVGLGRLRVLAERSDATRIKTSTRNYLNKLIIYEWILIYCISKMRDNKIEFSII